MGKGGEKCSQFGISFIRRMASSEVVRRVALVRTDVSEKLAPPSSG
jgi:hypothetical protein